jgi:N-acetylmuramic acid 6-phosphate etherase
MRYSLKGDNFVRLARSGGWGHLLGDEGGGYAIGREAIQRCLSLIEDRRLGLRKQGASAFEREILAYFGFNSLEAGIDLLSEVVSTQSHGSVKSRIAGAAQVVLALAASDQSAADIVSGQVSHLVDITLGRILDPNCQGYVPSTESMLILTGGLMLNETYHTIFQKELLERGIHFKHVEAVTDAAANGAIFLAANSQK